MKKLGFIVMPLMAVSLLASCGGSKEPTKVSYTLTYTYDNGTDDKYVETYDEDKKTVKPTWVPENPGYTFDGWFTKSDKEGDLFAFGSVLTSDTVIFAHWTSIVPTTYTVTFNAGPGGKFLNGEQEISFKLDSGTKLLPYIKQLLPPTSEGQTFAYYEYEEKDNAIDYDDVVTSDITLKANYFASSTPKTDDLTDFDWKTIKNIAVTGNPSQQFNIGATKKVTINEKDHAVRIIDFNHDYSELPDDGSNPNPNKVLGITFEFIDLITDSSGNEVTTKWNDKDDLSFTNYDYRESTFNDFLNNNVLDMLPSSGNPSNPDLREVIKSVDKKVGVSADEGQNYIATSFDGSIHPYPYLFALAHDEMANHEDFVTGDEGTKYQYYIEHSNQADRIKKKVDDSSDTGGDYWLRSPYIDSNEGDAWRINFGGVLSHGDVCDLAIAVAPAFCI